MVRLFSSGREGDNVIYKSTSDAEKDQLVDQLIKAKDDIILAKNTEIVTLNKYINQLESMKSAASWGYRLPFIR